jgi:hypothetical protein
MRLSLLLVVLSACAGLSPARRAELETAAQPALTALQAAKFDEAKTLADEALAKDELNARAAAISAIAHYRLAVHDFINDALTIAASVAASMMTRGDVLNQDFLDFMLNRAETRLSEVDALLARAEKDPGVTLDLCPACWEVDWNRSGEVDEHDRRLLEVELGEDGEPYEENDPRRRPTFHFDVADVAWLRALVNFQRSLLALGAAYDPNMTWRSRDAETMQLKLRDPKKLLAAQARLLEGLTHAEHCRTLVLAETDDEREWLPNPKQKNHALPMPVDDALFETWAGVLRDVRALATGQEGLSVTEVVQLGRHRWEQPPGGFIDFGAFFTQPHDLTVSASQLKQLKRHDGPGISELLGQILGNASKATMPASPLPARLQRMNAEVERGDETFQRKLRYLLWLN